MSAPTKAPPSASIAPSRPVTAVRSALIALALASVVFTWVAIDRWTPCLGGFDTLACGQRQDDSYDAALRAAFPAAPQLWGLAVATFGVALAVGTLGWASGRRWLAALPAALYVWMGVNHLVPLDIGPMFGYVFWGYTLAALPLHAILVYPLTGRRQFPTWLLALGITLTWLPVDYGSTMLVTQYMSWDAPPWMYTPSAVGCFLAVGVLVWLLRERHGRPMSAAG